MVGSGGCARQFVSSDSAVSDGMTTTGTPGTRGSVLGKRRKSKRRRPDALYAWLQSSIPTEGESLDPWNCHCGSRSQNRRVHPPSPPTDRFASLPHGADSLEDNKSPTRRRFSDPGLQDRVPPPPPPPPLPQQPEFLPRAESPLSMSSGSDRIDSRLIVCLVDHITSLKDTNRNMYKELQETKGELELLKRQMSVWRGDSLIGPSLRNSGMQSGCPSASSTMYAPGMLSDLVREIRDASKIREEALYSKFRNLLDDKYNKVNYNHEKTSEWRNGDQFRNQFSTMANDRSRTNDRLSKLEEELQNLRINQSRESHSPCSFTGPTFGGAVSPSVDQGYIRLQQELKKEKMAHSAAEAQIHKLELLVTQLQSKRSGSGNGGIYTPTSTPVHTNGTSLGDSRQLVLGPITDL